MLFSNSSFRTIQLGINSKIPAVSSWGASEPMTRLDELTAATDREMNYGVLTGKPSGVVVIDYDIYKLPVDEQTAFRKSIREFSGPDCGIVETASGGFHSYYAFNEETMGNWKCNAGLEGFIDVRTTGGYVVGPGSYVNGNDYKILYEGEKFGEMPVELFNKINDYQIAGAKKTTGAGAVAQHESIDPNEINELLAKAGFTNINWLSDGYNFNCDQMGRNSTCPLCMSNHASNHFRVSVCKDGNTIVKNHSQKCRAVRLKEATLEFIEENLANLSPYQAMKHTFEKTVAFIEDTVIYVIVKDDDTINMLSTTKLRERFLHLSYIEHDKTKSFIETWTRDPENAATSFLILFRKTVQSLHSIYGKATLLRKWNQIWNRFQLNPFLL